MEHYIVADGGVNGILPIIGAVSLSTGDGLDTKQVYSYDYSQKPQGLVYRTRTTALTASLSMTFTEALCNRFGWSIYDYLDTLHGIAGKKVEVYWNQRKVEDFVVVGVSFSAATDTASLFSSVSVSLELTQGTIHREELVTDVKAQ